MMKKNPFLTIVLPTFNEKDNVTPLLKKINISMKNVKYDYEVLFIDDSNDETPKIIKDAIKKNSKIKLVHRKKEERTGLATAFIQGFEKARGEYICCMDSDLQHPPSVIPKLAQKAQEEHSDIVVATRYIKGGSAEGLGSLHTFYGWYRRAVSLGMKYFTQIIFIPTRKSSDPLGGFFLFRRNLLKNVKLKPKGFKILVEILMRTKHKKVDEFPYKFLSRKNDDSKATIKQGLEFFSHLWFIFKTVPEARRFTTFLLIGFIGIFINLISLFLTFNYLNLKLNTAWLTGVILSVIHNYLANTLITYGDRKLKSRRKSLKRMLQYYLISAIVAVPNFLIFKFMINLGINYLIAAFIGIVFSASISFLITTKTIWKD